MQRLHSLVSLRNLNILLLSTFERRRIAVAAIITVLVLPLLMINNGDDTQNVEVAVTTTTQSDSGLNETSEDGSLEPIILGGPSPIVQDGSAQIAYPASSLTGVEAIASFSNFDNAPDIVCYFPEAPLASMSLCKISITDERQRAQMFFALLCRRVRRCFCIQKFLSLWRTL